MQITIMSPTIIILFCVSLTSSAMYIEKMRELKFWQMGRLVQTESREDHVLLRVRHPDVQELRIDEDASKILCESAHGHKDFSYILLQQVGEKEYGAKFVKNTNLIGSCGYCIAKIAEMGPENIVFVAENGKISNIIFYPISSTLSFDLHLKKKHKRFELRLMHNDINNLRMLGPKESWHFYWDYPTSRTVLLFTNQSTQDSFGFTAQNLRGSELIKCCISLARMRFRKQFFHDTSPGTIVQV